MKRINRMINEWLDRKFRERMQRAYPDADCDRDFKERMQRTYPDAEKFLNLICRMESVEDAFLLKGSFASTGFMSSRGLSTAYREWESKQIEIIGRKYPDLKIIVIRADKEEIDHSSKNLSNSDTGNTPL